jgi:hypothetical protein
MQKKLRLIFSLIFGGAFLSVGLFSMVNALLQQSASRQPSTSLSPAEVHLIRMVAAYNCHVSKGTIDRDAGRDQLYQLLVQNGIDTAILNNPTIQTVGWEFAKRLDDNCSSQGMNEKQEIQQLAAQLQRS